MSVSRSLKGEIRFSDSMKEKNENTVNNRNLIENNRNFISNNDNDNYNNSNNIEIDIYRSNTLKLKSIKNNNIDNENTELDNEKENISYETEEINKMKNKPNGNQENFSDKNENQQYQQNDENQQIEENENLDEQFLPIYPISNLLASTVLNQSKLKLKLKLRAPSSDARLQWISWLLKITEENN